MSLDLPDYNLNLAYCAKGQAWIMFAFLNDLTENKSKNIYCELFDY